MDELANTPAAISAGSTPQRLVGRPFVKGQSGNPRGRPRRDYDLAELARGHTPAAIATLAEIMTDTSAQPSARVAAATAILDRGWGKAPQALDVSHSVSIADEFEAFIRELNGGGRVLPGNVMAETVQDPADVEEGAG